MTSFFRYPHTPHLAWLGPGSPRDDKVLTNAERESFLRGPLVIEEKVDGANIGFSVGDGGDLLIQNRGSYLDRGAVAPQFKTLFRWTDANADILRMNLGKNRILFGEWCYALHSVRYLHLPDWFLAFDVYDRRLGEFVSTEERDEIVTGIGLGLVPCLGSGTFTLEALKGLLGRSELGASRGEGLYLRRSDASFRRAKLVTPEFTQAIGEHWSKRSLETNYVAESVHGR